MPPIIPAMPNRPSALAPGDAAAESSCLQAPRAGSQQVGATGNGRRAIDRAGRIRRRPASSALPRHRHATPARAGALLALALPALLAAAGSARAAEAKPLWELGIGAAGLHLPHYRGSDQSHNLLLPLPYIIYRGDIVKADRDGARAVLYDSGRVDFDLSLAASLPARSNDNRARAGMSDLRPIVEFGPNLNWTLARGPTWEVQLRVPVRGAFTVEARPQAIGWIASPGINLDLRLPDGWKLGLIAGPQYGSRRYNGYFYDVPSAAATAGRPAYEAPAGFGGGRALAAVSRRFAGGFAGAYVRYDTVGGAVFGDSPLVRQRSNLSFGVAYAWVFATSSRQVEGDN